MAETYDAYEILFNQYLKETKCLITNKDNKSDVIEDFNCILYAPPIGAVYQEDDPFPVFLEDNDFVESFKKHSMHIKQFVKRNKASSIRTLYLAGIKTFCGYWLYT
ncbi:hypothetical protein [Catenibacterium sp. co_0103]|uniref:hypothetical protein n=1 Tax=Catenibacterium sp. co_0103 TaxID=2478954 RepID=UPI00247A4CC3|nr:hypothetical protein [Catenibacterium sp. co_0103]